MNFHAGNGNPQIVDRRFEGKKRKTGFHVRLITVIPRLPNYLKIYALYSGLAF